MEQVSAIQEHEDNVVVVHYSCESFYDRPGGSSPRITSVAVRNLGTAQTRSFSIHQVAERREIPHAQIAADYDDLEREMLTDFYSYVAAHQKAKWLHWNMRDTTFGFPALEHRLRVLGGTPSSVDESRLYDLARILVDLYGIGYMKHPRLESLMAANNISDRHFLTGQEEASAFEASEFVKLHQSTLRKVDNFANIFERTADGSLKTYARLKDKYGGVLPATVDFLQQHWLISIVAIVGALASIMSLWR